jgi:hypothetical protein
MVTNGSKIILLNLSNGLKLRFGLRKLGLQILMGGSMTIVKFVGGASIRANSRSMGWVITITKMIIGFAQSATINLLANHNKKFNKD